ncbi:hypothetical protein ACTOTM_06780 [Bacillus subtilis]|uniref:Uncharacterized protein n=1 Tax=Bacillus subtilis TaxID=1423 RepID=A0AC61Z1E4_BACIU|nr:hypothetical protein P5658_18185 [Bacillus subtilis]
MIRATEKQLRLIGRMEQYISARFTGYTIREASEFISNHIDEYQEEREMVDESKVLYDDIFYEEGW